MAETGVQMGKTLLVLGLMLFIGGVPSRVACSEQWSPVYFQLNQDIGANAVDDRVVAVNSTSDTLEAPSLQQSNTADGQEESSRMFAGHRKRMQFALLPIMYKMGVMTTLLFGLVVLTLKGLTIGVILLIFAFVHAFSKHGKAHGHSQQPIHVHLHPGHSGHSSGDPHSKGAGYSYSYGPSGPWERAADDSSSQHVDPEPRPAWNTNPYHYYYPGRSQRYG